MNYEMPKMNIIELKKENLISTLTSTTTNGGGTINFPTPPGEEDDW